MHNNCNLTICSTHAFYFTSYTVKLDDDAGLAIVVTIITICDPRAILQYGAFELAGTLGEVFQAATVLLDEVLIRFTVIILLGLDCVVVRCIKEAT